ncbi:unnamed protein product [Pleuronectes platessa]|uniref:Uncharacterized protein n=1 Tax=Pleuronectes platessa TaxID=8262 RepID=A0A9N7VEY9_PLEPL|nr:unnamed protein product [Pleuronectes platessa]
MCSSSSGVGATSVLTLARCSDVSTFYCSLSRGTTDCPPFLPSENVVLKSPLLSKYQSDSSSDPPSHLQHPPAAIIEDMNICYILDGILILYGLILTVLYCRLRMVPDNNHPEKQPVKGGIYEGLRAPCADTYETIGKKAIV